jgi:predicted GIY-YIG superfamily endonuclease
MEFGTCYLICSDVPSPSGARHYIGWSKDVAARLEAHRKGRGGRLTKCMAKLGIRFEVVREWPNTTRGDEQRLKRRHQHARLCPKCRAESLKKHAARERNVRKAATDAK